jgi:ribosomal protein L11 methyltransferase
MCLELLLRLAGEEGGRGPALDLGCGSGVLAIAAAKLGFAPVLAVDSDPESVAATDLNAARNGVAVEVRGLDLRREPLPLDPVPEVLLANLVRGLLLQLAGLLADVPAERRPRQLILSGLLREEAAEVAAAFAAQLGLRERARRESGEWAALWLSR